MSSSHHHHHHPSAAEQATTRFLHARRSSANAEICCSWYLMYVRKIYIADNIVFFTSLRLKCTFKYTSKRSLVSYQSSKRHYYYAYPWVDVKVWFLNIIISFLFVLIHAFPLLYFVCVMLMCLHQWKVSKILDHKSYSLCAIYALMHLMIRKRENPISNIADVTASVFNVF